MAECGKQPKAQCSSNMDKRRWFPSGLSACVKAFQELPERVYDASAPWNGGFLSRSTIFDSACHSLSLSFRFPDSSWLILTRLDSSWRLALTIYYGLYDSVHTTSIAWSCLSFRSHAIPKQSPNYRVVWICLIWDRLWVVKFSDSSTTLCNFRTAHTSPGCSTQCTTFQTSCSPSKKCPISLATVSILGAVLSTVATLAWWYFRSCICPFHSLPRVCLSPLFLKPLIYGERRQEWCDSLTASQVYQASISLPGNQHWWHLTTTTMAKLVLTVSLDGRWGNPPLRRGWPCPKNTRNKSEPATIRHCWMILTVIWCDMTVPTFGGQRRVLQQLHTEHHC